MSLWDKLTGGKKAAEKGERRGVNLIHKYGGLLDDPELWNKWSKSKRHKFAKDFARADKYGAVGPFKTLRGKKGHSLREAVRDVAREARHERKGTEKYDAERKKYNHYKKHPEEAKKAHYNLKSNKKKLEEHPAAAKVSQGKPGKVHKIERYLPEQKKVLKHVSNEATKPDFNESAIGKVINKNDLALLEKGPPKTSKRKEPPLETPAASEKALKTKVNFKPEKVENYEDYYENRLNKGLETAKAAAQREVSQKTLPEILNAYTDSRGTGAFRRALVGLSENLQEKFAQLESEHAEKAIQFGQNRQGIGVNAANTGINRGSAQSGYQTNVGLGGYSNATSRINARYTGQQLDQSANQSAWQNYLSAVSNARAGGNTQDANRITQQQTSLGASPYESVLVPPVNQSQSPFFGGNIDVNNQSQQGPNYLLEGLRAVGGAAGRAAGNQFFG